MTRTVLLLLIGTMMPIVCFGDPPSPAASPSHLKLVVGIYSAPPFSIRQPDGSWSGICVELWQGIASDMKVDFEYQEIPVSRRFTGVMEGLTDVCIGPITITEQREELVDFTHTFFTSGLRVAMSTRRLSSNSNILLPVFEQLFSWPVLKLFTIILSVLVLVAILIWFFERRKNAAHFGGNGKKLTGVGSAVWWSAVTMTGVGYGDLYPRTVIGRVVAVGWMFVSLVLVSVFTATMASILTTQKLGLQRVIETAEDLRGLKVGTTINTTAAIYARKNHLNFQTFRADELLPALKEGKIDAAINDAPILLYQIHTLYPNELEVLPIHLDEEFYGFCVKEGSSLREPINRSLLNRLTQSRWKEVLEQYLGSE